MYRRLFRFMLSAFVLLCVALLESVPAQAAQTAQPGESVEPKAKVKKITGETLALEAAEVQSAHCADAYSAETTRALQSIAAVGEVWARVSVQYEDSGETFLLYWRGVLAQCMDQEARGLKDLKEFVAESGSSTLWAALVKDAARRIRQLERKLGGGAAAASARGNAPRPGAVIGISLAAGSAGTGIAAAISWGLAMERSNELTSHENPTLHSDSTDTSNSPNTFKEGESYAAATPRLAAVSVGLGLGAAVAFIIHAATANQPQAAAPPLLVPTVGGAAVVWEARW